MDISGSTRTSSSLRGSKSIVSESEMSSSHCDSDNTTSGNGMSPCSHCNPNHTTCTSESGVSPYSHNGSDDTTSRNAISPYSHCHSEDTTSESGILPYSLHNSEGTTSEIEEISSHLWDTDDSEPEDGGGSCSPRGSDTGQLLFTHSIISSLSPCSHTESQGISSVSEGSSESEWFSPPETPYQLTELPPLTVDSSDTEHRGLKRKRRKFPTGVKKRLTEIIETCEKTKNLEWLDYSYEKRLVSEEERQLCQESSDDISDTHIKKRRKNIAEKILDNLTTTPPCRIDKVTNVVMKTEPAKQFVLKIHNLWGNYHGKVSEPTHNLPKLMPPSKGDLKHHERNLLDKLHSKLNAAEFSEFANSVQSLRHSGLSANILYKIFYLEANEMLYKGDFKKSKSCISNAKRTLGQTVNPRRFEIEILSVEARMYLNKNKFGKCFNCIQHAKQLFREDPVGAEGKPMGWVMYFEGSVLRRIAPKQRRHVHGSDSTVTSSCSSQTTSDTEEENVDRQRQFIIKSLMDAIKHFENAEREREFRRGYCLVQIANILVGGGESWWDDNFKVSKDDLEKATEYLDIVEHFEGIDNVLMVDYNFARCDVLMRKGNYERAYQYAKDSLDMMDKFGITEDKDAVTKRIHILESRHLGMAT